MTEDAGLRVEPLRAGDLDEVLAIERASFATPWTQEMFLEEIRNARSRPLVFRQGARMVGYLCFWEVLDEAHLLNICVHPEFRGLGHGLQILAHLEQTCRKDAIKRIILEVGRRNRVARNLYHRHGFRTVGFRKGYYQDIKDDALIMEKLLDETAETSPPENEPGVRNEEH
ncbi:MAG: ribosomal protein S18-alanine N-acetyltransferase [Thermodesulfobacteriota bacterium]